MNRLMGSIFSLMFCIPASSLFSVDHWSGIKSAGIGYSDTEKGGVPQSECFNHELYKAVWAQAIKDGKKISIGAENELNAVLRKHKTCRALWYSPGRMKTIPQAMYDDCGPLFNLFKELCETKLLPERDRCILEDEVHEYQNAEKNDDEYIYKYFRKVGIIAYGTRKTLTSSCSRKNSFPNPSCPWRGATQISSSPCFFTTWLWFHPR
jgi:hypothetical protein